MTILTDQEKQDIAETVVHMSFDINYSESIAHVCELAEAAVIRKLATVSVEPCAWEVETEQQDGTRAKWVSTDRKRHREFCDFGEPRQLYSQEAIAAARVQALEDAAKICECQWSTLEERDAGIEYAEAIRALIGGKDEPSPNH